MSFPVPPTMMKDSASEAPAFDVLLHVDSADATDGQTTVTDKAGNYTFTPSGTAAYSDAQSYDPSGVSLYTPAGSTFRTTHNDPATNISGSQNVIFESRIWYPEFGNWTSIIGAGASGERSTCFFGFHDDRGIAPNNTRILTPSVAPVTSAWLYFKWERIDGTATLYFNDVQVWTGANSDAIVCAQFEMPDTSYSPTGGGYVDMIKISVEAA